MQKELQSYFDAFENTEKFNDEVFQYFSAKVDEISYLAAHRNYIEANSLGFGDRAFHYMWLLLIKHLVDENVKLSFLEIGVYKGQILSLWTLILKQLGITDRVDINGITPLQGNIRPASQLLNKIRSKISSKFREDEQNGNFYDNADYQSIIEMLYQKFNLDFSGTTILQGYSTQRAIINRAGEKRYSLIYIDGDHSYNGVANDINHYTPLLINQGFLVMDDASCNIPGTKFWKGHKAVSDACELLSELNFINVLNVGHNRIYKKVN